MRRIIITCSGVAFAAFLAGIGMYANMRSTRPAVLASEADYYRIEEGMTQDEVEAILGGPPGDYRSQTFHEVNFLAGSLGMPPAGRMEEWLGNEGKILVVFDDKNRVAWKGHPNMTIPVEPPTLLDRVRTKLGL
jgi:hypothetical protein